MGGGGLTVDMAGVGDVCLERLNGAEAGHGSLAGIPNKGDHGEPSIADLVLRGLGGLHAKGVKGDHVQKAALNTGSSSLNLGSVQRAQGRRSELKFLS